MSKIIKLKHGERFFVRLAATGNPDHREYYGEGVLAPTLWLPVYSLAEASALCRKYISYFGLGGGNWTGGKLTDKTFGKEIGKVSYNGRVWPPGEWTPASRPIYRPSSGC